MSARKLSSDLATVRRRMLVEGSPSQVAQREISEGKRTWIEIDADAIRRNCAFFRRLIHPVRGRPLQTAAAVPREAGERTSSGVKLWSVVKSNAYGHGLWQFTRVAEPFIDGFCVDSVIEGFRLRKEGIKKPILALGPTLPPRFPIAQAKNVAVSVASFADLKAVLAMKRPPAFHIKVDTGMHRQGFYSNDLEEVIRKISKSEFLISKRFEGVFTHFASAKDPRDHVYTERQFKNFLEAIRIFERAGYRNLTRHAAATGGVLLDKKYHLDAVRIGIGLYGYPPSPELARACARAGGLHPVLSWRTVVCDVKPVRRGDLVGYDGTERMARDSQMAVLPVGYWHGFPRSLSSIGEVLIRGKRAKVLGRVSMDLLVVDVTGIGARTGDCATLLGRGRGTELSAAAVAERAGTTHYEFLTRLNPLIERVVVFP